MATYTEIAAKAAKNGFESYGSFNEEGEEHEVFTCLKGKYDGEVIDVYYDYYTGVVRKAEVSTQFASQSPTFVI